MNYVDMSGNDFTLGNIIGDVVGTIGVIGGTALFIIAAPETIVVGLITLAVYETVVFGTTYSYACTFASGC